MVRCIRKAMESDVESTSRFQRNDNPRDDDDSPSPNECVVCLERMDFDVGDFYALDCCGKRIHIACMEAWSNEQHKKQRTPTCPLCRSDKWEDESVADSIGALEEASPPPPVHTNRRTDQEQVQLLSAPHYANLSDDDEDEDVVSRCCDRPLQKMIVSGCLALLIIYIMYMSISQ